MDGNTDIIGAVHTNVQHDSAVKRIGGRAIYVDDIPALPNMQEAVLVLSPHARAKFCQLTQPSSIDARGKRRYNLICIRA